MSDLGATTAHQVKGEDTSGLILITMTESISYSFGESAPQSSTSSGDYEYHRNESDQEQHHIDYNPDYSR